jgi:pre-mRNA-splicing factor SPF27
VFAVCVTHSCLTAVARELAVERGTEKKDLSAFVAHLKPVPSLAFENSVFLGKEFERIRAGKPSIKFSTRRAKVPIPEKADDVEGWQAAVNAAKVEVGYLNGRLLDLQLLKKYGKDAWTTHNELLSFTKDFLDRHVEEVRIETNEINLARKREHTLAGNQLSRLEARYWTLEKQSDAVENAINELKKKKRKAENE